MVERVPSRLDAALRVGASTLGTLPAAVAGAVCLARFLPLDEEARFVVGFTLAIPLWITAMCFAFLARRGARAWVVCLAATALFAALVYGGPQ